MPSRFRPVSTSGAGARDRGRPEPRDGDCENARSEGRSNFSSRAPGERLAEGGAPAAGGRFELELNASSREGRRRCSTTRRADCANQPSPGGPARVSLLFNTCIYVIRSQVSTSRALLVERTLTSQFEPAQPSGPWHITPARDQRASSTHVSISAPTAPNCKCRGRSSCCQIQTAGNISRNRARVLSSSGSETAPRRSGKVGCVPSSTQARIDPCDSGKSRRLR
jgi:hypothetical protein